MTRTFRALCVLALVLGASACVTKKVLRRPGTQSFKVEIVEEPSGGRGTKAAPLPYAVASVPLELRLRATAIGWDGAVDTSYTGQVFIEARPGELDYRELNVINGVGEITVRLSNAFGETRLWVEDCGTRVAPLRADCSLEERASWLGECLETFQAGTLASGLSPALWFDMPSLAEVQETANNTTSPLVAKRGDRCASLADLRFVDVSKYDDKQLEDLQYENPGLFAPKNGASLTVRRGTMIVTAIDNEGFFLTDVSAEGSANGFNHLFIFNFNYPEGLQVGDRVLEVQGSPTEFSGSSQLQNPFWIRDLKGPYPALVPKPVVVTADQYKANIKAGGSNDNGLLDLEKLEGAVVCMDGLAPPGELRQCDKNQNGQISRSGKLCEWKGTPAEKAALGCRGAVKTNPLIDCNADCDTFGSCDDAVFVRDNIDEFCCELECYNDPNCSEASTYLGYQQWASHVVGAGEPVARVAISSLGAVPEFNPVKFVKEKTDKGEPVPTLAVTGNLIHVIASRPVWLIQPRGREDFVIGGTCPAPPTP